MLTRVVREGTARAEARALAERVSVHSPHAVAATKKLLNELEGGLRPPRRVGARAPRHPGLQPSDASASNRRRRVWG